MPSEDPYHAGTYAASFVRGMQEEDGDGHPKMLAFLKHYAVYSQETGRGSDSENVSQFDLFDTYLPQYEIAFTAGATGAMCSYNSPLGQPSCANGFLNDVIRKRWNFSEVLVSTDCGAVTDMKGAPAYGGAHAAAAGLSADELVASWAIENGTDLEMGSMSFLHGLANATRHGLTSEATITRAARRTLLPLFRAGRFDSLQSVEWSSFNASTVGAPLHLQIRDEAALQSFVLLKNEKHTLPLGPNDRWGAAAQHIAVLGPQSSGQGLFSDYFGGEHSQWFPVLFSPLVAIPSDVLAES